MRRLFFVTVLLCTGFLSCLKDDDKQNCSTVTAAAPASEIAALKQYIDTNQIDAQADNRGFYYKIHTPGGTDKPTVCSNIIATYKGTFTNGTKFDEGPLNYPLSNLITGWQEGIPLIGAGGSITLYLPPSLAYGPNDYQDIPGGSILIFDISLTSF